MNVFKQRLLNAALAVRQSPAPRRFTMLRETHDCGTPACVWGHYYLRTDLQNVFVPHAERGLARLRGIPNGNSLAFYSREVREHFGLTYDESYQLFDVDGCGNAQTTEEAVAYIEAFCERKWPEPKAPDWNALAGKWTVGDDVRSQELA